MGTSPTDLLRILIARSTPKPIVTVLLWEHAGTGLIVPYPTGITYANQVGGNACLQLDCEGFFVPIANDVGLEPEHRLRSPENTLYDYFRRNSYGECLTDKHAKAIEAAFADFPLWQGLSVDRQKLDQSYESWVHVNVTFDTDIYTASISRPTPKVTGLGRQFSAILTWTNTN